MSEFISVYLSILSTLNAYINNVLVIPIKVISYSELIVVFLRDIGSITTLNVTNVNICNPLFNGTLAQKNHTNY